MTGMARVASRTSLTARLLRMFMPGIVAHPGRDQQPRAAGPWDDDPAAGSASDQHLGSSRSRASMLSPTFRSLSVSFEAWNSCVFPSVSVTATLPWA